MEKAIKYIAAIGAIGWSIFIAYAIVASSIQYHASGFMGWVGRLSGEAKLALFFSAPLIGAFIAGIVGGAIIIALGETIFKGVLRLFKD